MTALLINIAIALIFTGLINRVRAFFSGRRGIRIFQHIYNVMLLLKKNAVYGTTTSIVFKIVPVAYFVVLLCSLCFIPVGNFPALLGFDGDFVFFIYLLALSRLLLLLGALDTGNSFEGMGTSREALYGALAEPTLLVILGTTALMTGNTSFGRVVEMGGYSMESNILCFLILYIFIKIIIIESGRIPMDDTRTHLELTMIHEAMVLDYCGIDLALINTGGWIKNSALIGIGSMIAYSISGFEISYLLFLACVVIITTVFIGITESFKARNKLSRNPVYIITVDVLAVLVFFIAYIVTLEINI
ncbi:MAG: NADH-quinone oxidoreductase subunit H [Rikenellaceae bacterium]|nr:NADH-quinone oxidoreductase subunit H [Rikenellaceae bacterium]